MAGFVDFQPDVVFRERERESTSLNTTESTESQRNEVADNRIKEKRLKYIPQGQHL